MDGVATRDLFVLLPDSHMRAVFDVVLSRPQELGIRPITYDVYAHPHRDSGVHHEGAAFVRTRARGYSRFVMAFDREHYGTKDPPLAKELSEAVRVQLARMDLADRTVALVLDPELEVWAWSDLADVARTMGWSSPNEIKQWLVTNDIEWPPSDPKRAFHAALRERGLKRSAAVYSELTAAARLDRCTDPAFAALVRALREWFPLISDES